MTGPEHYREAEAVIAQVKNRDVPRDMVMAYAAVAQVHATLAVAAAFACAQLGEMPLWDADAWQNLAGTEPHAVPAEPTP